MLIVIHHMQWKNCVRDMFNLRNDSNLPIRSALDYALHIGWMSLWIHNLISTEITMTSFVRTYYVWSHPKVNLT